MIRSSTLPLHDGRFALRALEHGDAEDFAAGTKDQDVRAFAHLPRDDYTPATVRQMVREETAPALARGELAVLAVADDDTGRLVGSLVLFDVTEDTAEVGFWIAAEHRGSGAAGAALRLGVRLAQLSGLQTLTARTVTENPASQRVLTRAGFLETGRRREATPSGRDADVVRFSYACGAGFDI